MPGSLRSLLLSLRNLTTALAISADGTTVAGTWQDISFHQGGSNIAASPPATETRPSRLSLQASVALMPRQLDVPATPQPYVLGAEASLTAPADRYNSVAALRARRELHVRRGRLDVPGAPAAPGGYKAATAAVPTAAASAGFIISAVEVSRASRSERAVVGMAGIVTVRSPCASTRLRSATPWVGSWPTGSARAWVAPTTAGQPASGSAARIGVKAGATPAAGDDDAVS